MLPYVSFLLKYRIHILMYTALTHDIKVTVHPIYLEGQSLPEDDYYVWAYTVQVENLSDVTVQLVNRYWHITDANGQVEEVNGAGVIGEQPILKPGEAFQYTSGCSLRTPSGIMQGHYEMQDGEDHAFNIDIPAFSLDSNEQIARPN